mgnify:FL=1
MSRTLIKTLPNGVKMWKYRSMKGGDKDVDVTVALMKQYAKKDYMSPEIQAIAKKIRAQTSNDIEEMRAAFMYIVDNVKYVDDGTNEVVASPRHVLTWLKKGDCDCMTTALVTLLMALGYKDVYAKVIAWKEDPTGKNEFTHVYAMALIPSLGFVVPLDPVMESSGFGDEKQPQKRNKIYRIA